MLAERVSGGVMFAGGRPSVSFTNSIVRQHDLALSYGRGALVAKLLGKPRPAVKQFQIGRSIITELIEMRPDHVVLKSYLDWFDCQLAEMT